MTFLLKFKLFSLIFKYFSLGQPVYLQGWEWKIIPRLKRILPTKRALSSAAAATEGKRGGSILPRKGRQGHLPLKIFLF